MYYFHIYLKTCSVHWSSSYLFFSPLEDGVDNKFPCPIEELSRGFPLLALFKGSSPLFMCKLPRPRDRWLPGFDKAACEIGCFTAPPPNVSFGLWCESPPCWERPPPKPRLEAPNPRPNWPPYFYPNPSFRFSILLSTPPRFDRNVVPMAPGSLLPKLRLFWLVPTSWAWPPGLAPPPRLSLLRTSVPTLWRYGLFVVTPPTLSCFYILQLFLFDCSFNLSISFTAFSYFLWMLFSSDMASSLAVKRWLFS